MKVDVKEQLWNCYAGCGGGSVIDFISKMDCKTIGEVLRGDNTKPMRVAAKPASSAVDKVERKLVDSYVYENALGHAVFRVNRYIETHSDGTTKKTFTQDRFNEGKWIPGLSGVQRVLFNLPKVRASQEVWLVEGEKDALTLISLGFTATTNAGGGSAWSDAYAEDLKGKDVIICPDQDKVGKKHCDVVFESLIEHAKTIRIVDLPPPNKDVSDFCVVEGEKSRVELEKLRNDSTPHIRGIRMPLFTMAELEEKYKSFVQDMPNTSLNLGRWLPSLSRLRAMVPGELAMIVGNTGIGKTALLCSIAVRFKEMPAILFELELPQELVFERVLAARLHERCTQIEENYLKRDEIGREVLDAQFPNFLVCCEPNITLERLEQIIINSELKLGKRPRLILLDYVQLMAGPGTRRERFSDIAEGLKILAKKLRVMIIIASQISRPDTDDPRIGLHDAKETGSLENSCGIVMGAWRETGDDELMHLAVLKASKGGSGLRVRCNYDAPRMVINERIDKRTEESMI
jgi:hypothetical protein